MMSYPSEKQEAAVEQELIRRAQKGDNAALDELLSSHQDRVYRTALGLVGGDSDAAMEVAQQVLISAFRHIGQFRGESKFSTWLYRMTVNFSKNRAVAVGRQAARIVSLDSPPPAFDGEEPARSPQYRDEAPGPRELAAGSEMRDILRERLTRLPEEFRSALTLRYMEDMSYEEIAETLEVPVGTVKSRINRGRAELRAIMGDVLPSRRTAS